MIFLPSRWQRRNWDHLDNPGDHQGKEKEGKSSKEGDVQLPSKMKYLNFHCFGKKKGFVMIRLEIEISSGGNDSTNGDGAENEARK